MIQVLFELERAISIASKDEAVKEFVARNDAYLVSTHAILSTETSISSWGLNYYSPTLGQAKTFEVSQEIGQEYTITADAPSELREKDLRKLDLAGTKPLQELLDEAYKKKQGTINNIIVTVSHPPESKNPVLRLNLISSQFVIQSIVADMKTGRILKNVTDNVTGTKIIAGTVKLK